MTREFLKENVPGITDEQITAILNENGKDKSELQKAIDTKTQELATITTERDSLQTQITERDNDIKELRSQAGDNADIQQRLDDLQAKYDNDTQALKDQLTQQALDYDAEKFVNGYEFSSDYARRAILADFKAKNFERNEKGEFVGATDWMDEIKKASPDAFKVKAEPAPPAPTEPPQPAPPTPHFAQSTNPEPKKLSLLEQMRLANGNK